jgi:hypothetical protein
MDFLEALAADINPGIIEVTETWLSGDTEDAKVSLSIYDLFRKDRYNSKNGGGVLLFIAKHLQVIKCSLSNTFSGQVWRY